MIIDCHAHVFQHWAGPCGHLSNEVHRRYMQKVQTRTSARVFRVRDGKVMSGALLFREDKNGWSGLRDVDFRVGRNGQLDFTVDGENYRSQYMPVGMQEIVAPPELMLAQMQYAGVDHCVLQAGWGYGARNDYNAFAQSQYPDRFSALLNVDETICGTGPGLAEFERAVRLGLKGVYFALDGFARTDFEMALGDRRLDPFWTRVQAAGLPVFIECTAVPGYDRAGYVAAMVDLKAVMGRYPTVRWILVMGPPVGLFEADGTWKFPDEVLEAYRCDNLWIEVMFPITWGGAWEYPYVEAQALIRGMRDLFGAGKLVWGLDMPNVERFCSYTQCVDYVRRHCSFLSAAEKDAILGDTMAGLLGLKS